MVHGEFSFRLFLQYQQILPCIRGKIQPQDLSEADSYRNPLHICFCVIFLSESVLVSL